MSFALISESYSQDLIHKLSNILNVPIFKMVSLQRFNRKIQLIASENFIVDEIFIVMASIAHAHYLNDALMELMFFINFCKTKSKAKLNLVIPYIPYSRQDKLGPFRNSLTFRILLKMIEIAGANRIITFDAHSGEFGNLTNLPVINLNPYFLLFEKLKKLIDINPSNNVIVTPDFGSIMRCKDVIRELGIPSAIILKEREICGSISKMFLIGNVENKDVIILDDIADTFSTLMEASNILIKKGARTITAVVIHAILSKCAIENLIESSISTFVFTNTVPISNDMEKFYLKKGESKLIQIDISNLLGECIQKLSSRC